MECIDVNVEMVVLSDHELIPSFSSIIDEYLGRDFIWT